jgi:hypothetical protein
MTELFDGISQNYPNQAKKWIPCHMTKKSLYQEYKLQKGEEAASADIWKKVWKMEFSDVKIPKRSPFSKCDTCADLKYQIRKAPDRYHRNEIEKKLKMHNTINQANRQKFYRHNEKAMQHPEKYFSMIVDGMTQDTTLLPHMCLKPSWWTKASALENQVTGVITWGAGGKKAHMELSYKNISDNTNFLIDTIERSIIRNQEECDRLGIRYPHTAYFQLDNVSHNKSKTFMAYCAALIMKGIFKKVKVSFLIKGHTHEVIDQMFSKLSQYLAKCDAITLEEMMERARRCYKPSPTTELIQHQFNWDLYLRSREEGLFQNFSNISKNRYTI